MPQVALRLRPLHALTTLFAERCKNFTMTRGGDCEAGGAGRWDGISLYETCQNLLRLVRITITTDDLVNFIFTDQNGDDFAMCYYQSPSHHRSREIITKATCCEY